MDDAVKIRMLLFDIEFQADLAIRRWHHLCVDIFDKWILVVKIDDFLLQFRHLLHIAIPFLLDSVSSCLKAGRIALTGASACAQSPAHNGGTSACNGSPADTHQCQDRQRP